LECFCGGFLGTLPSSRYVKRDENARQSRGWKQIELRKLGLVHHHAEEPRLCSSFQHVSLKSRNGSMAGLFNIPRNSVSVLFGAKYVSTIILTALCAFSMVCIFDRTRIRLIKAYTFTKSDISALLCPSASALSLDVSSIKSAVRRSLDDFG
jgi:hypothetical protein